MANLPGYVELARDVEAIAIPDGKPAPLAQGTPVKLTQALGFAYTIQTEKGAKYRLNGRDGDAIGQKVLGTLALGHDIPQEPAALEALAREQLKGVYDPEIPVDIINLGLVHTLKVLPVGPTDPGDPSAPGAASEGISPASPATSSIPVNSKGFLAEVRMGLTSPGCGMGDVLVKDVEAALKAIPGIVAVDAKVVLFPVWNPHTMMSEAAKLKLGML